MTDCPHPEDQRGSTILMDDDPEYAYCKACRCVIKLVDGVWVPDSVPGQITKATYTRGRRRRG